MSPPIEGDENVRWRGQRDLALSLCLTYPKHLFASRTFLGILSASGLKGGRARSYGLKFFGKLKGEGEEGTKGLRDLGTKGSARGGRGPGRRRGLSGLRRRCCGVGALSAPEPWESRFLTECPERSTMLHLWNTGAGDEGAPQGELELSFFPFSRTRSRELDRMDQL